MKCLVTGGAGFIGSHLVASLEGRGHKVRVLDNLSTGSKKNLDGSKAEFIEGDLRDNDVVSQAVTGINVVFHEAALCSVPRSVKDPSSTYDVNVSGTLVLLEACQRAGVKRLVFASSSSVYGESEVLPKHEKMPTKPISPYAMSKLMGEQACLAYANSFDLEVVVLRYFNVFGPRQNPDSEYAAVIPKFIQAIANGTSPVVYGDGEQTRDFTYVDNVVTANWLAATTKGISGQIMNVACGDRWSLLQLIKSIEQTMDFNVSPEFRDTRAGDVKHSQASIAKAGKQMGFSPVIGLDEGLEDTVNWYLKAHGLQPEETMASYA